ncbi:hypothetical protein L21SP5_01448 [Salinivirga cyanobacteriivorans]|uniref:Uncharacterized protein n=1 Tax=Salinivirga cyanobacteriivorans TaxID=1307839 RepID=A0A0S2HYF3_9BACT|nr:hypothetical protein L21SP5_01448 [Salinivirga cyanobacteriivorans]
MVAKKGFRLENRNPANNAEEAGSGVNQILFLIAVNLN